MDIIKADAYVTNAEELLIKNQFKQSNLIYEKAVPIYEGLQEWEKLITVYNEMGHNYLSIAQYKAAETIQEKALQVAEKQQIKNERLWANIYNNLAISKGKQGDAKTHLVLQKKALAILESYGETSSNELSIMYHNIGNAIYPYGDLNEALAYVKKGIELQIIANGKTSRALVRMYNFAGIIYETKKDREQAYQYFGKALAICLNTKNTSKVNLARCYNNIGNNRMEVGAYETAKTYLEDAINLWLKEDGIGEYNGFTGQTYNNLAVCYGRLKQFDKLIAISSKSLKIREDVFGKSHPKTFLGIANLGNAYAKKGAHEIALTYYEKSLVGREKLLGKTHITTLRNYVQIAKAFFKLQRETEGFLYYKKVLDVLFPDCENKPIFEKINLEITPDSTVLLDTLAGMGKAYLLTDKRNNRQVNLENALRYLDSALQIFRHIWHTYFFENSKLSYNKDGIVIFQQAIKAAVLLYQITGEQVYQEKAFFYSENCKSLLLYSACKDISDKQIAGIDADNVGKELRLKKQLLATEKQLQKAEEEKGNLAAIKDWQAAYFDAATTYKKFVEGLYKAYPKYSELKYQIAPISSQELIKKIAPQQAMVEYLFAENYLATFVITASGIQVFYQAETSNLLAKIKRFIRAFKQVNYFDYLSLAHELYQVLIAPIKKSLANIETLIIIPENELLYIPFEALIANAVKEATFGDIDFSEMSFLLKDYKIKYHYSATLWANAKTNKNKALAANYKKHFLGISPSYKEYTAAVNTKDLVIPKLKELPHSTFEVTTVAKLFKQANQSTKVVLNEAATNHYFEKLTGQYACVLFAGHAIKNAHVPTLSALAFNPSIAQQEVISDGLLTATSIYTLQFKTDLLVLSACESGKGIIAKGEGAIGLNRGFLYRCTNNVVFTLFKVYDKQSSELVQLFFEELLAGKTYEAALQAAKLKYLKKFPFDFPLVWASYILIGV